MNRKQIGQIGMMASAFTLSLEIFSLKILQSLDKITGEWETSAWSYLTCPTSLLALLLVLIVFVVSLVLYLNGKENL
ncbi:hypothetical protein [Butyricicoccus pullicaecorum]|uniref:hypothetical protein n=1 Tax=Butyricicoccus pullicaecorum TaxID=501571 RepID=UPI00352118BB